MQDDPGRTGPIEPFPQPTAQPGGRWRFIMAACIISVVYLGSVTDKWWPTPDSSLYMGLGRSLAEGGGYRFNGRVSNAVAPGLPLALAGVRLAFGQHVWPANALMALSGLGALWMIFLTIGLFASRQMAQAVTVACAFSYTFFANSHVVLTDAPLTLLFWGLLYALARAHRGSLGWLALASVLAAVALVVRVPGSLLLGALGVGLMFDKPAAGRGRRPLVCGAVLLAVTAVVFGALCLVAYNSSQQTPLYATNFQVMPSPAGMMLRLVGGLFKLPSALAEMFTSQDGTVPAILLGWPMLLLAAVGSSLLMRRGHRAPVIMTWPYILGLAVLLDTQAVRPRYLMPVQPILFYMAGVALVWAVERLAARRGHMPASRLAGRALGVLVILVVVSSAPRLLRNAVYYTYLSYADGYYRRLGEEPARLMDMAACVRTHTAPGQTLAASEGQVSALHYLTRRIVIGLPNQIATPQRAHEVAEDLRARQGDYALVVIVTHKMPSAALNALRQDIEGTAGMEVVCHQASWTAYRPGARHQGR